MENRTFGEYLKQERKKRKMTQKEFCKIIGVSVNTLVKYERGSFTPSITKQQRIKDILSGALTRGADMGFAEDLKSMREDLGLSIQDAAKKIGCAYNTFKRYETGESTPSKERQEEIFIQLGNTDADTEIDSILNDIAAQEIEIAKRKAAENRLLLPLLRSLGYEVVAENELFCWQKSSGERTNGVTYNELSSDLEAIKEAMITVVKQKMLSQKLEPSSREHKHITQ